MFRKYRCYLTTDNVKQVEFMTLKQMIQALFNGYTITLVS